MDSAWEQFKVWYNSKPLFTRTYLAIVTGLTILVSLRLLNPMNLIYFFRSTFFQFQIWRPFTAFFFMGKFSFGFLFNAYFAFIAISKVQTMVFTRDRYTDFLWLNVVLFLGCVVVGSIVSVGVFSRIYQMAMIYIWCKKFPNQQITFMFGFRVKTGYFPFVYAIAMTLFGDDIMGYLIGIALGHAYIFMTDIVPIRYHKDYLKTPRWFDNWWHGRGIGGGAGAGGNAGGFAARGGAFGGQGVRLG